MNKYLFTWAALITKENLQPLVKKWLLDETVYFTKLGANTLLAPFANKDRALFCALKLAQKYQLSGRILTFTAKQYEMKQFIGDEINEPEFKNFHYKLVIETGCNKLIIPITKQQVYTMINMSNGIKK